MMPEGRNFHLQQKNEIIRHTQNAWPHFQHLQTTMCFVFPACLAQQQEFKSQSWFSDQSIRSRCVPFIYLFIFAHVAESWMHHGQTMIFHSSLWRQKNKQKPKRIAPWPVSAGPEGLLKPASNLQLAQDAAACYSMMILIKTLIKFSVEVIN